MFDNVKNSVLLVGAGYMAEEYAKVLIAQGRNFVTVGRGKKRVSELSDKLNIDVYEGGINKYIENHVDLPQSAIVAVSVGNLSEVAIKLMNIGIKNILLEKPGGLTFDEVYEVNNVAKASNSDIFIAYNRRFYASVIEAQKRINEDGGIKSFNFEFTEWPTAVLQLPAEELQYLFFNNSTHVVDMAFYLGGKPVEMESFIAGSLPWHKQAAAFAGAGKTKKNATFCYQANWDAPGRWSVEFLTNKHRYIFRPMEKLQVQEMNSVRVDYVDIDDELDLKFKPGLYREVNAFLNKDDPMKDTLCTIAEHCGDIGFYKKMLGIR